MMIDTTHFSAEGWTASQYVKFVPHLQRIKSTQNFFLIQLDVTGCTHRIEP